LALEPFIVLVAAYLAVSDARLSRNPDDKLTPSISKMVDAVELMAFTRDRRTGEYLMLRDTLSSLRRIAIGIGLAAMVGLMLGINMAALPGINALLLPIVKFLSIIPPLAVLPILFITFGVDELGKVMLIFIGSLFVITRTIQNESQKIPQELIVKALTLGASEQQVIYRVIMQMVMPSLITTIRICLGGAWLFLIAAEAIASTDGLGYRIFLVRRYMSMDIIIPYALWITCLGFAMDTLLRLVIKWKYSWYEAQKS
jgi:NitT/TauT family transport system permease protein